MCIIIFQIIKPTSKTFKDIKLFNTIYKKCRNTINILLYLYSLYTIYSNNYTSLSSKFQVI